MFDVPILILAFNRPEETQQVFDRVRAVKPKQLFVGIDGPRSHKPAEAKQCKAVQDIFLTQVDWDCEVKTLFREQNLGCRYAVSGAIDWFFEQVEYGIILEDDCVADLTYFTFCKELLIKYKDNPKVMQIGALNAMGINPETDKSYFFSKQYTISGWASWRRAWSLMDVDMKTLPEDIEQNKLISFAPNALGQKYVLNKWIETYKKINNSWAYAWYYTIIHHDGYVIMPSKNLMKNIGFNEAGTHTQNAQNPIATVKQYSLDFPLKHPEDFRLYPNAEQTIFYKKHKSFLGLILFFMKRPNLWGKLHP